MPRMSTWRTVVLTLCAVLLVALGAAGAVVGLGLYPVAATRQHWQAVHGVLETTMRHSVQRAARGIAVPDLSDPALLQRGAACFRAHCVQCHGAPGVAPAAIGLGMQPLPGPLVDAAQRWQLNELYWITRKGIRMSGMPAWEFRLDDADLWALVAMLGQLPRLDPAGYAALDRASAAYAVRPGSAVADACTRVVPAPAETAARAPDAARGRTALAQYACISCHQVPGVTGPASAVGPPLAGVGARGRVAGRLANTPQNMVRWLRDPRAVDPQTAMPDLGVSEADARDIAAYLATLR